MIRVSCCRAYKRIVFAISAPSGCLQYYYNPSGVIRSFNYSPSPSGGLNAIGVEGTRQIANLRYGICIQATSSCSITYSILSSDPNSFTMTGDVGAVDPVMLGSGILQDQNCKCAAFPLTIHKLSMSDLRKKNVELPTIAGNTDYVIIPDPSQSGSSLSSDRFCGLGLNPTTSKRKRKRELPSCILVRCTCCIPIDHDETEFARLP